MSEEKICMYCNNNSGDKLIPLPCGKYICRSCDYRSLGGGERTESYCSGCNGVNPDCSFSSDKAADDLKPYGAISGKCYKCGGAAKLHNKKNMGSFCCECGEWVCTKCSYIYHGQRICKECYSKIEDKNLLKCRRCYKIYKRTELENDTCICGSTNFRESDSSTQPSSPTFDHFFSQTMEVSQPPRRRIVRDDE